MTSPLRDVIIRAAGLDDVLALRGAVLRPGLPLNTVCYPGEMVTQAFYAGAFDGALLVGTATVFPAAHPHWGEDGVWRLRGMAVAESWRGRGVGRRLVEACLAHTRTHGGWLVWCHARTAVMGFYRMLGFQPVGDEFMSPVSGPHYLMALQIV